MGQSGSTGARKRISKEERAEREKIKHSTIEQKIKNIDKAQEKFFINAQKSDVVDYKTMNQILHIGETAKQQLSRGGNTLTKSDLIAILVRLEPIYRKQLDVLSQYTVSDLNAIIRCVIYDTGNNILQIEEKVI